jgi:CheY-like chemotaxis protein
MPKLDGREALQRIKGDATLVDIPIVILTTSGLDADVIRSYRLGVNSFITKPVTFSGLVEAMNVLGKYWLEIVELPPTPMPIPA